MKAFYTQKTNFLPEECPAFLDYFTLQDCLPRDSVNQALKKGEERKWENRADKSGKKKGIVERSKCVRMERGEEVFAGIPSPVTAEGSGHNGQSPGMAKQAGLW